MKHLLPLFQNDAQVSGGSENQQTVDLRVKLPRIMQGRPGSGVDVLEYELFQEKAATLGRLGAKLKAALDALAAHDASPAGRGGGADAERAELVAAAGEALWYYVVQREVCGLRDTDAVLRHLGVPREVQLKMGMRPRQAGR